uniref:Integrase catalytic domain-containing protein n=1 Tax=Peronospora matthiolae TaxID=2874970 RepID=A0AAV1UZ15_9STRA
MMMNSRYEMVFPLRKKSEVTKAFKRYCHDIKIDCGLDVKALRSDNGGEYLNDEMTRFCHQEMIKQEFTVPYNPKQNGMAERLNRTLGEMTRCMLSESKMDKTFWCEAMLTAVDILNVLPRASSPNLSPFEMAFKRKPRMDIMRVFGSLCYAHIPKQNRNKLYLSGVRCIILGYAKQHKAYRLLNTATGKVFVSRSVTFVETAVEQTRKEDTPSVIDVVGDGEDMQDPRDHAISDEGTCTPVPGSPIMTPNTRKKQAIKRYEQEFPNLRRGTFNLDDYDASYATQYCLSAKEDVESASTYSQVLESKHKDDWIRAMKSEIQALTQHDTWTLQDLPSDKRSIGCKWVFRIKRKPNGEIVKFKARLVAKGFTQRPGVDYFETFSPVAREESINVAIALAAEQDLIMENVDVDTAFLYGEVKEEIYMDQPDGFVDKQHRDKKCHEEWIGRMSSNGRNELALKHNSLLVLLLRPTVIFTSTLC